MQAQESREKVIKAIRLEFAKFNQQAACNFDLTKSYLESSCQTLISQQIIYCIMKVQPSNRTQWMVDALSVLIQKYQFFSSHPNDALECCRYMELRKVNPHTEIITYGDDPDYFYIIFEGQAAVFVKRTIEQTEQQKRKIDGKGKDQISLDIDTQILSRKYFIQKGICKFKFTTIIKQGQSFGELGMLYNKPRMALVVAKTHCILGTLKKQDYLSIFFQQQKMIRNRKKKFISQVVLSQLKNLRYEAMQGILYRFQQKALTINDFLFKQNDNFSTFYIIYEGEILLFNSIGKFKKPITRIGQGGVICVQELKSFINKGQSPILKYSAQVSSSFVIVYKLQAVDILKIFDYREVFGSILKSFPETYHQHSKPNKPILKQFLSTEPSEKLSDQNLISHLKSQMLINIPQTSKESVALIRLRRQQARKQNNSSKRASFRRTSKFRQGILNKLNYQPDSSYNNSLALHRLSFSSIHNS